MFLIDIEQAWEQACIGKTGRALEYINNEIGNFGSQNIRIIFPLTQDTDRLLQALHGAFLTAEFVHSTARTTALLHSKQAILTMTIAIMLKDSIAVDQNTEFDKKLEQAIKTLDSLIFIETEQGKRERWGTFYKGIFRRQYLPTDSLSLQNKIDTRYKQIEQRIGERERQAQ